MQDIRPELQERLSEAGAKREKHLALAKEAEAEVASIRKMLEIEDRRFGAAEQQHRAPWEARVAAARSRPVENPLVDFLVSTLDDGNPHSLDELAIQAGSRGLRVEEGKSIKRAINATLLSLMHKQRAKQNGEGNWVGVKRREASPVSAGEAST